MSLLCLSQMSEYLSCTACHRGVNFNPCVTSTGLNRVIVPTFQVFSGPVRFLVCPFCGGDGDLDC